MAVSRRSTLAALCLLLALAASAGAGQASSFQVQVSGTGRPILLIPGLASSGATWTTTVAHLGGRFTCHVLTLAGFAGTPPIDGPLFSTVRRDLAEYIRQHRLDRPIVIGHSLGGMLAMALAADHPDLVGPLVIVDAMPFLAGPNMQVKNLDEARPAVARMEAYMSKMTQEQWDAYAKSGVSTRYMVTSASDADTLARWSATTDRQTLIRALADAYSLDLRQEIARISSPALVLGTWRGWHDQLAANKIVVPKEAFLQSFAEQFASLPRLRFALHDTARHFMMWDDPQWFFGQLDAFLANPMAATSSRGFDGK
ncbi:MAG TPA: alpha/beta hydrolase [Vicinamibacterales bacterium]|nr:alpha/beta hydrolase [Vicinamibacterales bacterium]